MLKDSIQTQDNGEGPIYEPIDFYPEYKHPTPGEFPIIGNMLSHSHLFDRVFSLMFRKTSLKTPDILIKTRA